MKLAVESCTPPSTRPAPRKPEPRNSSFSVPIVSHALARRGNSASQPSLRAVLDGACARMSSRCVWQAMEEISVTGTPLSRKPTYWIHGSNVRTLREGLGPHALLPVELQAMGDRHRQQRAQRLLEGGHDLLGNPPRSRAAARWYSPSPAAPDCRQHRGRPWPRHGRWARWRRSAAWRRAPAVPSGTAPPWAPGRCACRAAPADAGSPPCAPPAARPAAENSAILVLV